MDSIVSHLEGKDPELRQLIDIFQDMELINTATLWIQYDSFLKQTFPFTDKLTSERNRTLFDERIAEYVSVCLSFL